VAGLPCTGLDLGFALIAFGLMPVWSSPLAHPSGTWWSTASSSLAVVARCCSKLEERGRCLRNKLGVRRVPASSRWIRGAVVVAEYGGHLLDLVLEF
jgi:hypothetical protein